MNLPVLLLVEGSSSVGAGGSGPRQGEIQEILVRVEVWVEGLGWGDRDRPAAVGASLAGGLAREGTGSGWIGVRGGTFFTPSL